MPAAGQRWKPCLDGGGVRLCRSTTVDGRARSFAGFARGRAPACPAVPYDRPMAFARSKVDQRGMPLDQTA